MIMTHSPTKNPFVNPETGKISITEAFGENLAILLAEKIVPVYKKFKSTEFIQETKAAVIGKSYTQRVEIIADLLRHHLPEKYTEALKILMNILGPENTEETGMFTHFYWLMPVGKFVEKYGLDTFSESIQAIEEKALMQTKTFSRVVEHSFELFGVCKKCDA